MGCCCGQDTEARGRENVRRQAALVAVPLPIQEEAADNADRVDLIAHVAPLNARFTAAGLLYRSSDGGDLPVGSLYFASGYRIRLVHKSGPELGRKQAAERWCVDDFGDVLCHDLMRQKQWWTTPSATLKANLRGHLTAAAAGVPGKLLELGPGTQKHLSRGGPTAVQRFNQRQINAIVQAATTHDNQSMRDCFATLDQLA